MPDPSPPVDTPFAAARQGVKDVAPMLLGIIPFGLVAGAAPIAAGLDVAHAIGLSSFLFAGASQLAVVEVLADDGGVAIAVLTALTINLRLLLYSASLAPLLSTEPLGRRLRAAYLLVDQVYALAIVRWSEDTETARRLRLPYYFAIGLFLWANWQVMTVIGAVVGSSVPEDIPLDFAIPLVFLVLLVPVLAPRHAQVAAAVGGLAAVVAAEVGADRVAIMVGGLCGIVAGAVAETWWPAEEIRLRDGDP